MFRRNLSAIVIGAAMLSGSAALADSGFYYGLGLGYTNADSTGDGIGFDDSEASFTSIGIVLGYRVENGSTFFGGELDGEISQDALFEGVGSGVDCSVGSGAPYYCSHDTTLRLRGIAGRGLGNGLEFFGTAGLVKVSGESAINPGPNMVAGVHSTGFTVGAGIQKQIQSGQILRFEVIYDKADDSNEPGGYTPTYKALTWKAGFIF